MDNNKKLSDLLLKKINKENIKPIPKWIFTLKFLFKVITIIIISLISSIIFSIILLYTTNIDSSMISKIGIFETIGILLPIYWIILLVFSTLLTLFLFRETGKGYRYKFGVIFAYNILVYSILGFLFFSQNYASKIENMTFKYFASDKAVLHYTIKNKIKEVWQNPEKGLLAGEIIKITPKYMIIKDLNEQRWIIEFYKGTKFRSDLFNKVIHKVKIEGVMKNDNTFIASKIKPYLNKDLMKKIFGAEFVNHNSHNKIMINNNNNNNENK